MASSSRIPPSLSPRVLATDELEGAYSKLLQLWGGLDQVLKTNEMPGTEVE